jgi:hypothetical protein
MRFPRRIAIASTILGVGLGFISLAAAPPTAGSVSGKAVVAGKTLSLQHVWLVRAPNKFDATKVSSFAVLSAEDISPAIRKCADRNCVTYEALKNGMLIEPSEPGFWVFVAHPELPAETQFSGPNGGDTGWKSAPAKTPDRLAGTLRYEDKAGKTSVDVTVDAPLLKEFPTKK